MLNLQINHKQRDTLIRILRRRADDLSDHLKRAHEMGATLHIPLVRDELAVLASLQAALVTPDVEDGHGEG